MPATPSRPPAQAESSETVFVALADPTRRAILQAVVDDGPLTATALAEQFPMTRQGVAKHLGVLRQAGLVHARRQGRETRFEADLGPLDEVTDWVTTVGAHWDRRLARLARVATRRA